MMDNFIRVNTLRTERTLIWPDRLVPYVDPRDVAEAAADVFLSTNGDAMHGVVTLNNGQDLLRGRDIANLMGEVIQSPIEFDGTRDSYLMAYSTALEQKFKRKHAAEYLWSYFEYERSVEHNWVLSNSLELILGRRPTTLRAWIDEHRAPLFTTKE
jgi:nucleoside-diphosphate-sugar epimerase